MISNAQRILFIIYDFGNLDNTDLQKFFDSSIDWAFYSEKDSRKYLKDKIVFHNHSELINTIKNYDYVVPICSNIFFFPGFFGDIIQRIRSNDKIILITNKLFFNSENKELKPSINDSFNYEQAIFQNSFDLIFGNAYNAEFFAQNNVNAYLIDKKSVLSLYKENRIDFCINNYFVLDEKRVWNTIKKYFSKSTMLEIIRDNLQLLPESGNVRSNYLKQFIKKMILYKIPCTYDSCFYIDGYLTKIENFVYRMNSIFCFKLLSVFLFKHRAFLYKFIKHNKKNCSCLKDSTKQRLIFLGAPDYDNIGDHAIFLGSIKFLKEYFSDLEILVIKENECFENKKLISKKIRRDDILVFQGGGNIGNEYGQEKLRNYFLTRHHDNKSVIMPSSIYFSSKKSTYKSDIKKAEKYYSNENILLSTREGTSFDFALKHFKCKLTQCADMALFLNYEKLDTSNRKGALVCLRSDKESSLDFDKKLQILDFLHKKYKKLFITDTVLDFSIDCCDSEKVIDQYIYMFSQYSIICTDRFHGVILSHISRTNCLAFPNYNHKVHMVSEMLGGKEFLLDGLEMFLIEGDYVFKNETFLNLANKIKEHIK